MTVADRTKSINLELLEEMFQIEEKEKTLNAGKLNVQETGISEHINSNSMFEMNRESNSHIMESVTPFMEETLDPFCL